MSIYKIAHQAYRRTTESELNIFAIHVIKSMRHENYESLQQQWQPLVDLVDKYGYFLAATRNGGITETVAKKLAKAALIRQLNVVADALTRFAQGDKQLLVNAGFILQKSKRQVRYSHKLMPPIILHTAGTGKIGELHVQLDDQSPPGAVVSHIIEYKLAQSNEWIQHGFNSYRRFIIRQLPPGRDHFLRIRSLGHGDNLSEWSEPIIITVL